MINIVRYILFCFLIVFFISCKKNALEKEISQTSIDSRLNFYRDLIINNKLNVDSIYIIVNNLKEIEKSIASDSLHAKNYYLQSRCYRKLKQVDSAISILEKATLLSKGKLDTKNEILYYKSLLTRYNRKEDFLNGIATSNKFIKLLDSSDYKNIIYGYWNLQVIAESRFNYNDALKYNDSIIKYSQKAIDEKRLASSYASRYGYFIELNDFENAKNVFVKIKDYLDELSSYDKYVLYGTKGYYESTKFNYLEAIKNYKISLKNAKKTESLSNTSLANCYLNLADAFISIDNINNSKKYIDSLKQYQPLLDTDSQQVMYKVKIRIALKQNEIDKAEAFSDSLISNNKRAYDNLIDSEFAELNRVNENKRILQEKNQKNELEKVKYQRNQYVLIASLIGGLFLISTIVYRNKQRKLQFDNQNFLMQQRLLRSQMNPHFTSNTLSQIHSFIKKDKIEGSNYLLKFSKLLRLMFNNSTKDYIYLEDEIELITNYLDVQKLNVTNNFDYKICNKVDDNDFKIPPMLLQPFIENILIHGFSGIDYKGEINITLDVTDSYLYCEIDDNGIGYHHEEYKMKNNSSTKLIKDFIEKATKKKVEIINKKKNLNQTGTIVKLYLPIKM